MLFRCVFILYLRKETTVKISKTNNNFSFFCSLESERGQRRRMMTHKMRSFYCNFLFICLFHLYFTIKIKCFVLFWKLEIIPLIYHKCDKKSPHITFKIKLIIALLHKKTNLKPILAGE